MSKKIYKEPSAWTLTKVYSQARTPDWAGKYRADILYLTTLSKSQKEVHQNNDNMEYEFYTKRIDDKQPEINNYPAFTLIETKWDDFNYRTNFVLIFYRNSRDREEIGNVKFLQRGKQKTELPSDFTRLESYYCSLGQDNSFYTRISHLFETEIALQILNAMNDIACCKGLISEFENDPGFKTSLIRSSEAQKALKEGEKIIKGISIKNSFEFTFDTKVPGFVDNHKISFDFKNDSILPKRLVAFIGKNGSGKTQVLSKLAYSLSGYSEQGTFNTKYLPPFSRVLALSYSIFDNFEKPKKSKSYSYFYLGIDERNKNSREKQIERRFKTAFSIIIENNITPVFIAYIKELLNDEILDRILDSDSIDIKPNFKIYSPNGYSEFSSGEIILLLSTAEILSLIREESLLLFDEPETHLHPNAISKFISVLYKILARYNSYAIIATHSPQIIQEIPSSSVYLFSKSENISAVRKVGIETFGENLTTLTEKIFQTVDLDEYYKKVLINLSKNYTAKQILKLFKADGESLSFNAKIFLENLYD